MTVLHMPPREPRPRWALWSKSEARAFVRWQRRNAARVARLTLRRWMLR